METDKTRVTIRQATFEPFDPDRKFVYQTARSRAGSALARALARVREAPDGEREAAYFEALAYYEKAKERCRQVTLAARDARDKAAARHARVAEALAALSRAASQARARLRQLAPGLDPAQAYDAADRLPNPDAVRNAYRDWRAALDTLRDYHPRPRDKAAAAAALKAQLDPARARLRGLAPREYPSEVEQLAQRLRDADPGRAAELADAHAQWQAALAAYRPRPR